MRVPVLLLCVMLFGCSRKVEANSSPPHSAGANREGGRKAEVTPALAEKAEELLKENSDADIGKEFPFELDGKRYVGRMEVHDNPTGNPDRPAGKHKGITVYEVH